MAKTIEITPSRDDQNEGQKSEVQLEIKDGRMFVNGLPDADKLEYVAVARNQDTRDSTYFVVHRPEKDWNYNSFRLHIGKENELREAKVDHVERYRDGGTTNIDYQMNGKDGRLHFPTPFEESAKPTDTYAGKVVTLENLLSY